MKCRKLLCVFLLTLCLPFLSGCWNYRELDSLNMVSAFAIDPGTQGHSYHLTFEFLDATSQAQPSKTMETEGDTIFDAIRNATAISQKKLYFSSCKTVIVNQDLARKGICALFDFILRDAELRLTLLPLISKEKTAGEILQHESQSSQLIGLELAKVLEQDSIYLAKAHRVPIFDAYSMLHQPGMSLTLPFVEINSSKSGKVPMVDGTAVFRDDKMVGSLDPEETQYFLYIRNEIKGGLLLTAVNGSKKNVSLEILGSHTTLNSQTAGSRISMQISIHTKSEFGENQSVKNLITQAGLSEVQQCAEKTLREGITDVIKRVQSDYGSDIFGFGKELHENTPVYWNKVKNDWNHKFTSVEFTVEPQMIIQGSATARGNNKAVDQNG